MAMKKFIDDMRQVKPEMANAEERQGQDGLAVWVWRAWRKKRHLIVPAGTGTGQTRGYVVPAIVSGRRVVVSTVTKALQDQISQNDLPLLAKALNPTLDHELTWTVLKGRSNYLCRQRIAELADRAQSRLQLHDFSPRIKADFTKRVGWAVPTETGDERQMEG